MSTQPTAFGARASRLQSRRFHRLGHTGADPNVVDAGGNTGSKLAEKARPTLLPYYLTTLPP